MTNSLNSIASTFGAGNLGHQFFRLFITDPLIRFYNQIIIERDDREKQKEKKEEREKQKKKKEEREKAESKESQKKIKREKWKFVNEVTVPGKC